MATMIPNRKRRALHNRTGAEAEVEGGCAASTESLQPYYGVAVKDDHHVVDHAVDYVWGRVQTNGLENSGSLLKHSACPPVRWMNLLGMIGSRVIILRMANDGQSKQP